MISSSVSILALRVAFSSNGRDDFTRHPPDIKRGHVRRSLATGLFSEGNAMRYLAALLLLVPYTLLADTTVTPGPWTLYRGTSIVQPRVDYPTEAACVAAADATNELRRFTCRTITTVDVTADTMPPPPPPEEPVCFVGCTAFGVGNWECQVRQVATCAVGYTESQGPAGWWIYRPLDGTPTDPTDPPTEPTDPPTDPTDPPPPPPVGGIPEGWPAEVPAVPFDWERVPAVNQTVALSVGSSGTSLSVADGLTGTITGTGDPIINITCNGGVIHNLQVTGATVRVTGSNCVFRDSVIDGDGRTTKNGASMSGGNNVFARNTVTRMLGNDRHCVTGGGVEGGSSTGGYWIFDNEISECSGDGFQTGHQMSANPPQNIYIFHNNMHHNRENAVDLKWVNNVLVVENRMHGHRTAPKDSSWCLPSRPSQCSVSNSGSDGTGMVFGADGTAMNVRALRNEVYDNANGFRVESGGGVTEIAGNRIHSLLTGSEGGANVAIQLDKDGPDTRISGNDIAASVGIRQNWRTNFRLTIDGNTFRGARIIVESGSVAQNSTLTNNVFTPPVSIAWGNQQTSNPATIGSGNTVQ